MIWFHLYSTSSNYDYLKPTPTRSSDAVKRRQIWTGGIQHRGKPLGGPRERGSVASNTESWWQRQKPTHWASSCGRAGVVREPCVRLTASASFRAERLPMKLALTSVLAADLAHLQTLCAMWTSRTMLCVQHVLCVRKHTPMSKTHTKPHIHRPLPVFLRCSELATVHCDLAHHDLTEYTTLCHSQKNPAQNNMSASCRLTNRHTCTPCACEHTHIYTFRNSCTYEIRTLVHCIPLTSSFHIFNTSDDPARWQCTRQSIFYLIYLPISGTV